jgi:hypothetical protein
LARQTVNRVANDVRTTTLILRWKEREEKRLDQALGLALDGLLRDLKSRKPDRHAPARRDLLRFVTAGDPGLHRIGDAGGSSEGDFTLEELLFTMRTVTRKGS